MYRRSLQALDRSVGPAGFSGTYSTLATFPRFPPMNQPATIPSAHHRNNRRFPARCGAAATPLGGGLRLANPIIQPSRPLRGMRSPRRVATLLPYPPLAAAPSDGAPLGGGPVGGAPSPLAVVVPPLWRVARAA